MMNPMYMKTKNASGQWTTFGGSHLTRGNVQDIFLVEPGYLS